MTLSSILACRGGCSTGASSDLPTTEAPRAPSGKISDAVLRRVDITGDWTMEIDDGFTAVVTGDQVTFADATRKVAVSSIRVDTPAGDAQPADQIRASLGPKLEADDVVERTSLSVGHLRGEAVIARQDERWSLRGFVAANGSVASCMIDFDHEADTAWAKETFRSLRHP